MKAWASVSRDALAAGRETNLLWFRLFVLMHVAVRTCLQLGAQPPGSWYAINSQDLILCSLVEQAGVGRASATLDVERVDRYSYDRSTLLR